MTGITADQLQINFSRLKTALSMKVALRGLKESAPRRLLRVIDTHLAERTDGQAPLTDRIDKELEQIRGNRGASEFYTQQKELLYLLTVLTSLDALLQSRSAQARQALLPVIKNRYQALEDRHVRREIGKQINKLLQHERAEIRRIASYIRDEPVSSEDVELLADVSLPADVGNEIVRRMVAQSQIADFIPQLEAYLQDLADRQQAKRMEGRSHREEVGDDTQKYIEAIGRVLADEKGTHGYTQKLLDRFLGGELKCEGLWLTLAMQLGDAGLDYVLRAVAAEDAPAERLTNVWPLIIEHARRQNRKAEEFAADIARWDSPLADDALRRLASFNHHPVVTPNLDRILSELRVHYKEHRMIKRLRDLDLKRKPQAEELEPIVARQLNEDRIDLGAYNRLGANYLATLSVYLRRFQDGVDDDQLRRAMPYVRNLFMELHSRGGRRPQDGLEKRWGEVLSDRLMNLLHKSKPFPTETAKHIVMLLVHLRFTLDDKNAETVNANAEPHTEFHQFLRTRWSELFKNPATLRKTKANRESP